MSSDIPGYYAPVHRSLTEPILIGGVPPNVAIGLGMAGSLFGFAWHLWELLFLVAIAWFGARHVCQRDPYMLDIIRTNRGQKNRYLP